jgi:hypothetical protein
VVSGFVLSEAQHPHCARSTAQRRYPRHSLATWGQNTAIVQSITDGGDIAHIILLGNYVGSTFTASNDGFGGTSMVDPHVSASQTVSLAQTHKG